MRPRSLRFVLLPVLALAAVLPLHGQSLEIDTTPGRFDFGKMWTFEAPPAQSFSELSVLRVPGCSASFVSGSGPEATKHHCIRGPLASVQREGESDLAELAAGRIDGGR